MKVSLIQSVLVWESEANRNHFEQEINAIPNDVDLIVLPEMFTSGFTMNPAAVSETMQGRNGYLAQTLTRNCAMGSYC
jgi:predicted amidohydrolase